MDQRVAFCDLTEPQIERDVTVPWRSSRVVILSSAIRTLAAIRLHRDQRVPAVHRLENEIAVGDRRVALRPSPFRQDGGDQPRADADKGGPGFSQSPAA